MSNDKKLGNQETEFININSYISSKKKETPFTYKTVLLFVSILTFAIILALLIVCLIKFFI